MHQDTQQNKSLKDKNVLITGASLGIGRATALAMAEQGANVVVNYRTHENDAEEVVQSARKLGVKAFKLRADVSDQGAVEQMVADAVQQWGRLDIAVSNAAYSDRGRFYEADMEGFRRTLDVTLWGAFHLLRAAAQQMIRQQSGAKPEDDPTVGGVIVLVSSPHAYIPVPRSMAYNMSKAALEQMAKTAAIELAEHRVRVNIIQPGWTDTPGERKFASEQTLKTAGAKTPLGRLGSPEEMARGIVFLSDPRNDYMTGSTLLIDGGISLPWWANRGSAAPE